MTVRAPFGWWPTGPNGKRWSWALGAATVALSIVLGVLEQQLKDAGASIVDFELARTFNRSFEIITGWAEAGRIGTAKTSVLVDFPYLVLYGLTLAAAATGLGRRLTERRYQPAGRWGLGVAWAAVVAALLDAAENVCLWLQLTGGPRRIYALPAVVFATAKFVVLAVVIAYLVVGGLASLRDRRA